MNKTYIYTSPDGGRTVYQSEFGKNEKTLMSQDDYAKAKEEIQYDVGLVGWPAIVMRKKHPGLQEAWDRYKTLWELTVTDEDLNSVENDE
jgi:hypothetical protein|tara:strand:- start:820 stop:1089 length:270 start_codon:yes stop_codon:yes gene_type:complete